jgi:hypothetical protein
MDLATAIRKSLTGFVCGMVGLLPIIGVPAAVYAVLCWSTVRLRYGTEWNPASNYLNAGLALALLGVLSSTVLVSAAIIAH